MVPLRCQFSGEVWSLSGVMYSFDCLFMALFRIYCHGLFSLEQWGEKSTAAVTVAMRTMTNNQYTSTSMKLSINCKEIFSLRSVVVRIGRKPGKYVFE